MRIALVVAICHVLPEKVEGLAQNFLFDLNPEVRAAFMVGLREIKREESEKMAFAIYLLDPNEKVQIEAAETLGKIGGEWTLNRIKQMEKGFHSDMIPDFIKKIMAKKVSEIIGPLITAFDEKEIIPLLHSLLETPYLVIHEAIFEQLRLKSRTISSGFLSVVFNYLINPPACSTHLAPVQWDGTGTEEQYVASITRIQRRRYQGKGYLDAAKEGLIANWKPQYYKKYIAEFRELLNSREWEIRSFAMQKLVEIDDNWLLLLNEVDQNLLDPEMLVKIGTRVKEKRDPQDLSALIQKMQSAKDGKEFKKYAYIIVGLIVAFGEEGKDLFGDLSKQAKEMLWQKLYEESASLPFKRIIISAFIKGIKLEGGDRRGGEVAEKLLALSGPLGVFALRNLAAIKDSFSDNVRQIIEGRASSLLLHQTPPYEEWFDERVNPNKVITAKIYFQLWLDVWEKVLMNEGFKITSQKGKETYLEKEENGVTLRVVLVNISDEQGRIHTDIFEDIADPDVQYIGYEGHAGMGGNIEMNHLNEDGTPSSFGTKLIQIGACWSMSSYYAKVLKLAPNSQFIGNIDRQYAEDAAKVFTTVLSGITSQKTWQEIEIDIRSKAPFIYHKQDHKPLEYLDFVLPHNKAQFKYAVFNELDLETGANTFSSMVPEEDMTEINAQYGGRLRQAAQNVNVHFSWQAFLNEIEVQTGDAVNDGVFFFGSEEERLRVSKSENSDRQIFAIEFNAAYSHLSINSLTMMLLYELNNYFSIRKHESLTKPDKIRGLIMVAEYIHYHYQGRMDEGLQLFELFKEKYGFAKEISYENVWVLREAIWNNDNAKKTEIEIKLNDLIP